LDPGAGSWSRIPDIPDPRSATLGEINLFQFVMINWSIGHSIFNFKTTLSPEEHKTIFYFLIINSRSQISDPDFYPSRILIITIPDPGSNKGNKKGGGKNLLSYHFS
jgi:hypothetical protein